MRQHCSNKRLTSKSVWDEEDRQRDVVFCASHVEARKQAFDFRIACAGQNVCR